MGRHSFTCSQQILALLVVVLLMVVGITVSGGTAVAADAAETSAVAGSKAKDPTSEEPDATGEDRKKNIEVELDVSYTHFSRNKLDVRGISFLESFLIGRIEVDEIVYDILTPSMTLRYPLNSKQSIAMNIPVLYRIDHLTEFGKTRPDDDGRSKPTETVYEGAGIGDIEVSFSQQEELGPGFAPLLTLGLRVPTGRDPYETSREDVPTGNGHYAARVGLT